jgi:putative flippase GtrA
MARKSKHKLLIQFVEYLVSGGVYFWVGYFILLYLYHVAGWNLWWSTIVSNVIGWSVNFVLQRFWVFSNRSLKGHQTQVTGRYTFITLLDFVLNYVILKGLLRVNIDPAVGQFISSGFFTIWNWFWYKYWVFPDKFAKKRAHVTPARVVAHRAHGHMGYHKVT